VIHGQYNKFVKNKLMTKRNGIVFDIFVIIGLSAGGYGLFLCHGLGVCLEVTGVISLLLGIYGHRNNIPKAPNK
jgi:hypothetical protein